MPSWQHARGNGGRGTEEGGREGGGLVNGRMKRDKRGKAYLRRSNVSSTSRSVNIAQQPCESNRSGSPCTHGLVQCNVTAHVCPSATRRSACSRGSQPATTSRASDVHSNRASVGTSRGRCGLSATSPPCASARRRRVTTGPGDRRARGARARAGWRLRAHHGHHSERARKWLRAE